MSFDWNNPEDLDSLINFDKVDEILANPDKPENAEILAIIEKLPE